MALADRRTGLVYRIVAGGTDTYVCMADLRSKNITGKEASSVCDKARITVNKNLMPFDPQKPMVTSGIRIGTPTVTSRGMKEEEIKKIVAVNDKVNL